MIPTDSITVAIAARLKEEREARGWTIAELALHSKVSRAMISRIERAEASPTAALLGRLSGAFGLPLSVLLGRAETATQRISRFHEQATWKDPGSGYIRRVISPPAGAPLELIDVQLPAGRSISFPASSYAFLHQQMWIGMGTLHFTEDGVTHVLEAGDCIQLGHPSDCTFENRTKEVCRYLVAILHR